MTQVCFVGDPEVNLRYELLSRETARDALQTYDLGTPFHNTLGVETVSLGAAVALVNDLNWYVVRFVDDVIVHEPSVSEAEWLSRDLATAVRDDELDPAASDRFLKVYGVEYGHGADRPEPGESDGNESGGDESEAGPDAGAADQGGPGADDGADDPGPPSTTGGGSPLGGDGGSATAVPPRLVEPMFVTRTGDTIPEYDLREVEETLVVRVTEAEFGA
jgi:hypothetical protein